MMIGTDIDVVKLLHVGLDRRIVLLLRHYIAV